LNSYFNGDNIPELTPGIWVADFTFKVDLRPGTYFKVDLGMRSPIQGEYADKAFNALVFEVAPDPDSFLPLLFSVPNKIEFTKAGEL